MNEKMTVKEKFARVIDIVEASEAEDKDMLIEFLNKRVALANKKASESKASKENKEVAEKVYEELKDNGLNAFTIADFLKATEVLKGVSSSKATAIIKVLVADGRVTVDDSKKRHTYSVAR